MAVPDIYETSPSPVSGWVSYNQEKSEINVYVSGNDRVKSAPDLTTESVGVDLTNVEVAKQFAQDAAPGGDGLEKYDFKRTGIQI